MGERMVLEDPTRKHAPGTLVTEGVGRFIEGAAGSAIPVEASLLPMTGMATIHRRSALAGVFRRDLGAGWPMPLLATFLVPLTLYVFPGFPVVHWRAKLVGLPDPTDPVARPRSGSVRLAPETSQPGCAGIVLAPDAAVDVGALEGDGPWFVGGRATCNATSEGLLGLALYGFSSQGPHRVAVAWAAVSNTRAW